MDEYEKVSGVKGDEVMMPADLPKEISKRRGFLRRTLTRVASAISRKPMKLESTGMRMYNVDKLKQGFERKSTQNTVDNYTKMIIHNEASQDPQKK